MENLPDVFLVYRDRLTESYPLMLGLFCLAIALGLAWRRFGDRIRRSPRGKAFIDVLPRLLLIVFALIGVSMAIAQASLVDDAFISFRYADNLVDGHGLVFNPGDRVEGYTNFLWTVLLALFHKITTLPIPWLALVFNIVFFAANLAVVYGIGSALFKERSSRNHLPLAAMLLSVQLTVLGYATSGLETSLTVLLVDLGIFFLVSRNDRRGAALAGAMFILSTFSRPDHAIFFVAGGLTVFWRVAGPIREALRAAPRAVWHNGADRLLAYSAAFVPYLVYLFWKLHYYGSILPNTYYAKDAGETSLAQGLTYAVSFYLGSHFWLVLALLLVWLVVPNPGKNSRSFKFFAVVVFLSYNAYVIKVGGDFMYGRFYVSIIPLLLLAAENLVFAVVRYSPATAGVGRYAAAVLIAGLLAATAHGTHIIGDHEYRWGITEEETVYPAFPIWKGKIFGTNAPNML